MNIIYSILITVVGFVGMYNYLPLDFVTFNHGKSNVGSTITTILGTDTLSASRSVINTNFSNLNTDKLESSYSGALSGVTGVGTLTSGTWNATVITVPYGGTGWASVQSNAVLYGNGTGKLSTTTAGVNGQFLSLVAGVPTWSDSSVDQTANFSWTGQHLFKNASTTVVGGLTIGGNSTTTNATSSNIYSSIARFLTQASTTDLFVSGTCTGCSSGQYTASSTTYSVTSGTVTYTGSIPALANVGLATYTIVETGSSDENGQLRINRAGMTSFSQDNKKTSNEANACTFSFSWSSSNFAVQETADSDGDCSISGIIYWYK